MKFGEFSTVRHIREHSLLEFVLWALVLRILPLGLPTVAALMRLFPEFWVARLQAFAEGLGGGLEEVFATKLHAAPDHTLSNFGLSNSPSFQCSRL